MADKQPDHMGDFFAMLKAAESSGRQSDPITEYIRFRIALWQHDGGQIKDLAERAGLTKSMPSQIKARTSAATLDSAPKFAKVFGYADLASLSVAANKWWQSDRSEVPPSSANDAGDPQAEALRIIQNYGISPQQIARVLERYPKAEYAHKDTLWWFAKFHESRSDDADRAAEARAEKAAATTQKRFVMRGRQDIQIAAKVAREKSKPASTNALTRPRPKRVSG